MRIPLLLHGRVADLRRAEIGWKVSPLSGLVKAGTEPSCHATPALSIVPRQAPDINNFLAAQHQIH
jgi:hypothetical protein